MEIPPLDDETFARELARQWIDDSRGALTPGYKPRGHAAPGLSGPHLREYVSLRSACEKWSRRDGLSKAAVADSRSALDLLTRLYSKGAIPVPDLYKSGLNWDDVPAAVGILSQAQLVQVDPHTVRITGEGMRYINDLLEPSR